jgi:hypothetical protein
MRWIVRGVRLSLAASASWDQCMVVRMHRVQNPRMLEGSERAAVFMACPCWLVSPFSGGRPEVRPRQDTDSESTDHGRGILAQAQLGHRIGIYCNIKDVIIHEIYLGEKFFPRAPAMSSAALPRLKECPCRVSG